MPGELFKRFLCRVGTLPVGLAEGLSAPHCTAAVLELHQIESDLWAGRDEVSARLYRAVGDSSAQPVRRSLVNARRSLYNLRLPNDADTPVLRTLSSEGGFDIVARYVGLLERHAELLTQARAAFEDEREASRSRLSQFCLTGSFQRGLLMSSLSLFNAQTRYHVSRPRGDLRGKLERIERALLRYLLRTATKATPFGTFCAVVPGMFETPRDTRTDRPSIGFRGGLSELRTSTRLNKGLSGNLWSILSSLPDVRKRLFIRLNSTLTCGDQDYEFLAVVHGRETFQRIDRTPTIDLVLGLLRGQHSHTFGSFVEQIARHEEIDSSVEQAEQFAIQLLESGCIELRSGVPQQDPDWDLPLLAMIGDSTDTAARTIEVLLRELRTALGRSVDAPLVEWSALVERATLMTTETFSSLGLGGDPGGPFREDASAKAVAAVPLDVFARAHQDIVRLVQLTHVLAWPRLEQASMRFFFERQYTEAEPEIPLLRFYEDYYRSHLKEHLHRLHAVATKREGSKDQYRIENPFEIPFVDAVLDAQKALSNLIVRRWQESPSAAEIAIEFEEIASITEPIPRPSPLRASVAMFGVVVPEPQVNGVAGARFLTRGLGYSLGYGRFFSRWLHMLPDEFRADVYASNCSRGDAYVAEICGDGNHNANLHPRLVEWELSYPGNEGETGGKVLDSTELVVRPDPDDDHALILLQSKSHQRIVPLDLGFLALDARPPLYQLLAAFAPPTTFGVSIPARPVPQPRGKSSGGDSAGVVADGAALSTSDHSEAVIHRPRIVLGALVVSRRCWRVRGSHVPVPAAGESDFEYFRRVTSWRVLHKIPRQVYVRAATGRIEASVSRAPDFSDERQNTERPLPLDVWRSIMNDRKPQFIDFESPLMVNLFGSMAKVPIDGDLVLIERYPSPESLPTVNGERHVTEQVIQLEVTLGCS